MKIFPLIDEPKPKPNIRKTSRRYLRREVDRRSRKNIDEINKWLDTESMEKRYHQYFLKIYFEWKYIIRQEPFFFKDMVSRKDEGEFLELLGIIQRELGLHYSEFPFQFEKVLDKLKEKLIDNKSQYNSRENCYIWSYE